MIAARAKGLLAGLVLVGIIAAIAWWTLREPPPVAFAPHHANDKVLIAGGWSAAELNKIVGDFGKLYVNQLKDGFDWDIRVRGALQEVRFPGDVAPWLFFYLVNYAQYPRGVKVEGRTILVAARATLTPDMLLPSQDLYGKPAVFYVPSNDTEFDNVYAQVAGVGAYKVSFETGEWTAASDARVPAGLDAMLEH